MLDTGSGGNWDRCGFSLLQLMAGESVEAWQAARPRVSLHHDSPVPAQPACTRTLGTLRPVPQKHKPVHPLYQQPN